MMNEARIEVLETAIKLKDEEITKLKKKLNVLYEHLSEIGNEIARLKKDNENAMDLLNDYVRREYGAWKGEIPGIMATYKKNSPPQPNAPFSLKNLLGVFDDGKGEKCDSCRFGPRVKGKHVDSCGNFKMADQCYLFGYGGFTPKKDSPPQPECPPHDWVEITSGEYKGVRCSICGKGEEPEKPPFIDQHFPYNYQKECRRLNQTLNWGRV